MSQKESLHQIFRDLHAERIRTMDPAKLQINIDQRKTLVETADRSKWVKAGDKVRPFDLPEVDGGRFPIKRVVGETVVVEADAFTDGHDAITCRLLWRPESQTKWNETEMEALPNDLWRAELTVAGRHVGSALADDNPLDSDWFAADLGQRPPPCPGAASSRRGSITRSR